MEANEVIRTRNFNARETDLGVRVAAATAFGLRFIP